VRVTVDRLYKESTKYTPEINFDPDSAQLTIKGKSYPENSNEFFADIMEWVEKYFESPREGTVFTFEIPYYNSSTSKALFDIMDVLDESKQGGASFSVVWRYDRDNEAAQDMGEEFQEDFEELSIELVAFDG
jgi:hypothetical protein